MTTEEILKINELPRTGVERGAAIDAAIVSLTTAGASKSEAIRQIAQTLGVKESSISTGHYRRATKAAGEPSKRASRQAAKSDVRWAEFERMINEMVEERVAARLDQARKALA